MDWGDIAIMNWPRGRGWPVGAKIVGNFSKLTKSAPKGRYPPKSAIFAQFLEVSKQNFFTASRWAGGGPPFVSRDTPMPKGGPVPGRPLNPGDFYLGTPEMGGGCQGITPQVIRGIFFRKSAATGYMQRLLDFGEVYYGVL